MQYWTTRTPQNQTERMEHMKAVKAYLLYACKGTTAAKTHPAIEKLQTPFLYHCAGTGMQRFEWTVLIYHLSQMKGLVAGFWPNIEVGDFRLIAEEMDLDCDERYLQPWVPRLDAVLLLYTGALVFVEIADSITPKLIGEACVKTSIYAHLHPTSIRIHSIQVIHLVGNNLVSELAVRALPTFKTHPIAIYHYDIADLKLDPNDPKTKLYART